MNFLGHAMDKSPFSLVSQNVQYFRRLAASIKKPFELRYNPYTASVDALTTSGQIKDLAKELRGDMFLISNAMRKLQVLSTMKNTFQFQLTFQR